MQKFTFNLRKCIFFSLAMVLLILMAFSNAADDRKKIHILLNKYYDIEAYLPSLIRYELNVTNTGFCRYKRIYKDGKEEFFAFNLTRFKSLDYYGNTSGGELWLRTRNDDVIVQTRKDKAGEVDSMATYMVIPLKNIDIDQLNELSALLRKNIHQKFVVNK